MEKKLSTSAHNSSIIGHDSDNSSMTASKNLEATLDENADIDVARISQSQDIDKRGKVCRIFITLGKMCLAIYIK